MSSKKEYLLSIIMPHYSEPYKYLKRALNSISVQLGIDQTDIEVILINDNNPTNIPKKSILCTNSGYEFSLKVFHTNVNGGPSIVRQLGTWISNGDYIMYLDADNVLHNTYSIRDNILVLRNDKNLDMVEGNLIEEILDEHGNLANVLNRGSTNDVATKIIRKLSLMNDNKILFDNKFRIHEDNMMSNLLKLRLKWRHIDIPFAVYYHRPNSTTTSESEVYASTILSTASINYLSEIHTKLIEDKNDVEMVKSTISEKILEHLFSMYYYYISSTKFDNYPKWREYGIQHLYYTFTRFIDFYPALASYDTIQSTKIAMRARSHMSSDYIETFVPSELYQKFMKSRTQYKSNPPKSPDDNILKKYVNNNSIVKFYDSLWTSNVLKMNEYSKIRENALRFLISVYTYN